MKPSPLILLATLLPALACRADAPPAPTQTAITVSLQTTVLLSPLRPDGTVDYIAAVNAKDSAGITPESNAAALLIRILSQDECDDTTLQPAVRRALGLTGPANEVQWFKCPDEPHADWQSWHRLQVQPWSAKDHPDLAAWLKTNEPALKIVVEASQRPHYWLPAVPKTKNPTLAVCANPQMMIQFEWGKALRRRSMMKLNEGDSLGARQDLAAAFRMNHLFAQRPDFLTILIASNNEVDLMDAQTSLLQNGTFTADQLKTMAAELEKDRLEPDVDEMYRRLEYESLDAVQMMAATWSEKLTKDDAATLQKSGIATPDWNRTLKIVANVYDDIRLTEDPSLTAAQRDAHHLAQERSAAYVHELATRYFKGGDLQTTWILPTPGEAQAAYSDRLGYCALTVMLPQTTAVRDEIARTNNRLAWSALSVALARYKIAHAAYPDTLEELTKSNALQQLPIDLPGQSSHYERRDKGYVITLTASDKRKSTIEMDH